VSYDGFGDCHDENAVASVDFISRQPIFMAFICKGRSASVSPYEDSNSRSSISLSMVSERKSRSRGDESASYVIPDNATTAGILLAI
jgi:hypothetical protein